MVRPFLFCLELSDLLLIVFRLEIFRHIRSECLHHLHKYLLVDRHVVVLEEGLGQFCGSDGIELIVSKLSGNAHGKVSDFAASDCLAVIVRCK